MNHQLLILLTALCLSGCNPPPQKPLEGPSPIQVLREQMESERQGRIEAEQAAVRESENRHRWELVAVGTLLLSAAAFLVGTILGSRGRRHAGQINP